MIWQVAIKVYERQLIAVVTPGFKGGGLKYRKIHETTELRRGIHQVSRLKLWEDSIKTKHPGTALTTTLAMRFNCQGLVRQMSRDICQCQCVRVGQA